MSTLTTKLYGSSTSKGYTGLSGLENVDELVDKMSLGTKNKINKAYQAQQKLKYKQSDYREVSSKLLTFSSKYFSYSSGSTSNVLSSSFFKSNTIESSSKYVNLSGDADNIKNFSITDITSVATAASFASTKTVSEHTFSTSELTDATSSLAGETFSIQYNDKTYSLTIDTTFGKNGDGDTLQEVADQLNKQLATMKDSDGKLINEGNAKLKYTLDGTGKKLAFETGTAKLAAGSSKFIDVLNLKTGQTAVSTEDVVTESLTTTKDKIFSDSDAYMTFDYNGISKTIKLNSTITDETKLKDYLQTELDKAYGTNADGTKKVTVAYDGASKKLSFTASGDTNLFGVSSISNELRYFTGIEPSTYNRVNQNIAIKETKLSTALTPATINIDGATKTGYSISINGKEFKFEETATLGDIMNKINSDVDAGVNIYYSSTTDTFTVKSTATGSNSGVDIKDVSGNLAASLFGKNYTNIDSLITDKLKTGESYVYNSVSGKYDISDGAGIIGTASVDADNNVTLAFTPTEFAYRNETENLTDYNIKSGTDTKMSYTLNGVPATITRSAATFSIDGINVDLNEKAVGVANTTTPVTFTVTSNADEVAEKVKQFITDYNEVIVLMANKTKQKPDSDYQPLTAEQKEDMEDAEIEKWEIESKKGMLFGDSKVNTALYALRDAMSSKTSVSNLILSDIGISSSSYDTSGQLTFDEETFKAQLAQNADQVAALFMGTTSDSNSIQGLAVQLQSILKDNVGTAGLAGILIDEAGLDDSMTSDTNSISETLNDYDDKLDELKEKYQDERERYYSKFTTLETTIASLNSQSSALTSLMGS